MDASHIALLTVCVLVLAGIAFFAVFRGKGEIEIDAKKGTLKAKGENPPSPTTVPGGVKIEDAEAGKNFRAHSSAAGGVDLKKVKAKGGIDAVHTPGDTPPKT